jgi:exodeoxyribonuclease V alpha subunit
MPEPCSETSRFPETRASRVIHCTAASRHSKNILGLGKAVRTGNTADALARLAGGSTDIEWIDPADATKLNAITKMAVTHAKKLHDVANGSDPGNVLKVQSEFQVLCGYREGEMGVSGWNTRIEKGLGVRATDPWYVGRPVMITRNTPSLRLANGDVGVIVPAGDRREAIFGLPGQSLRVPVAQLEDIDTVHAFTIHKSQGSEYDHVVVVLPDRPSRIVTRELLYTGITRARTKVTIVGLRHVIAAAIETPIRRATGLAARLAND